jgi:hypothetical protein
MRDILLVIRYTRYWIHYGIAVHVGVCILVGAVKGILER